MNRSEIPHSCHLRVLNCFKGENWAFLSFFRIFKVIDNTHMTWMRYFWPSHIIFTHKNLLFFFMVYSHFPLMKVHPHPQNPSCQLIVHYIWLSQWRISGAGAPRTPYGVPLGPGWPQDHARMDAPRKFRIRIRKIRKNRKIRFPPVLPYYGRTRAPTDMVGVPTDRAWPKDHAGAIETPEIRIRIELERENQFSRFALLRPNQGTYRHGRGTHGSGLT